MKARVLVVVDLAEIAVYLVDTDRAPADLLIPVVPGKRGRGSAGGHGRSRSKVKG
jgi:hypothetical protein